MQANQLLKKILKNKKQLKYSILSSPFFITEDNEPINSIICAKRMLIYAEINAYNEEGINKLKHIYSNWIAIERIFTSKAEFNVEIEDLIKIALEYQKISNLNGIEMIENKLDTGSKSLKSIAMGIRNDIKMNDSYKQLKVDVQHLIYLADLFDLKHVSSYWTHVSKAISNKKKY